MGLTRPTVVQLNTVVTEISDPISLLNRGSTLANVDVGLVLNRDMGTSPNVAIFWNETTDQFNLAYTSSSGGNNANVVVTGYANLRVNSIEGNLTGATSISTIGNINATTAWVNAGTVNVTGNLLAKIGTFNAISLNGVLNSTGNVLSTAGTFNSLTVNGGITSTGFINTSGNISGARVISGTGAFTNILTAGELFVTTVGGDEGGQINLGPAVTNTSLVGNVVIDVFQNRLRIYEGGGTNRGGYFDISGLSASVGTNLAGGGATPGGGPNQIQFNQSSSFAGAASLYYFGANGAIVANAGIASTSTTTGTFQVVGGIGVTGSVTADLINSVNNGNGTNFKVGDDVWLGDINIANTLGIRGQQDGAQGYVRFGNVNTNALGVNGSGPLSWGGVLNIGGNLLASTTTLGATTINGGITSTGFINTTANISASVARAGTITTTGTLTAAIVNSTGNIISTGAIHNSLSVNGTTTITDTAGAASATKVLSVVNGTYSVGVGARMGAGSYNPMVSVDDTVINFTNGTQGQGGLTIAPWSVHAGGGIKISSTGNTVTIGGSIIPYSSNAYTVGSSTAWYSAVWGKAVNAAYADLAETYTPDSEYAPGTVVVFGGEQEVTISSHSHDPAIAGVVSTNPAYHMNAAAEGVAIALTGRVPCQVRGPVRKGDRVVASDIPGVACRMDKALYEPGCIIGKSLEDITDDSIQTIEVVVGRL